MLGIGLASFWIALILSFVHLKVVRRKGVHCVESRFLVVKHVVVRSIDEFIFVSEGLTKDILKSLNLTLSVVEQLKIKEMLRIPKGEYLLRGLATV